MARPYSRRRFIVQAGCLTSGMLPFVNSLYACSERRRNTSATGRSFTQPASDPLTDSIHKRMIPGTQEALPVIGLGTWQTFDAGNDREKRAELEKVLEIFHREGGRVIDSSPMYGSSEEVAGSLSESMGLNEAFFFATKVWTSGKQAGIRQINESFRKFRRSRMDLLQVHNLLDYNTHIWTLKELKDRGKIRYLGITHYTSSAIPDMMRIIKNEKIDFVQCSYSLADMAVEKELLPLARDRGVGVIVNQPFSGGSLFNLTKGKALPEWAGEWEINSWAQFFLKFIISHPAVTCAIPGVSRPDHMMDDIRAGYGKLPDDAARKKMTRWMQDL